MFFHALIVILTKLASSLISHSVSSDKIKYDRFDMGNFRKEYSQSDYPVYDSQHQMGNFRKDYSQNDYPVHDSQHQGYGMHVLGDTAIAAY
jgi:hypothetical protein